MLSFLVLPFVLHQTETFYFFGLFRVKCRNFLLVEFFLLFEGYWFSRSLAFNFQFNSFEYNSRWLLILEYFGSVFSLLQHVSSGNLWKNILFWREMASGRIVQTGCPSELQTFVHDRNGQTEYSICSAMDLLGWADKMLSSGLYLTFTSEYFG